MAARLRSLLPTQSAPFPPGLIRVGGVAVALAAVAVVVVGWLGRFAADPRLLPPSQDISWYTWRTELLTAHPPGVLAGWEGPLGVFGGGYRVGTPTLGALLRGVAGMDRYSVSVLLIAGRLVLAALLVGAVAYRLRRDPAAFAAAALFAGGMFFFNPYLGFVDNVLAMVFAGASLLFLDDARSRWPARVAVGVLVFLAFFFHPPNATMFTAVAVAAVAARGVLGAGARVGLRGEGPVLAAVLAGALGAAASWRLGLWGPGRWFSDAAHPPPYPTETFVGTVREWLHLVPPGRLVPLIALGVLAAAVPWRRVRAEPSRRAALLWLLPVAGVLGYHLGLRYPFQRFLNGTLAPVVLAGLGGWLLARPFLALAARRSWLLPAAAVGVLLAGVAIVPVWRTGTDSYLDRRPWQGTDLRAALAAVSTFLERQEPVRPVILLTSAHPEARVDQIWGRAFKGDASRIRSGLSGRIQPSAFVVLAAVPDLVAGRSTITGNPLLDRLSAATYEEMLSGLRGRTPFVILIRQFNKRLLNKDFLEPPHSIRLDPNASVLLGERFARPDPLDVTVAAQAGRRVREEAAASVDRFARPLHLARVLLALFLLLVVPGLLAARWLGIRDLPTLIGAVPVLSLGLVLGWGLVVLALLRRPLSAGVAWAIVALACATGAGLLALARPAPEPEGPGQQPREDHG